MTVCNVTIVVMFFVAFSVKDLHITYAIPSCLDSNTNYLGADMKYVHNLGDWRDCQKQCEAVVRCKFWSIDSKGLCILKVTLAEKVYLQGTISGPEGCRKRCKEDCCTKTEPCMEDEGHCQNDEQCLDHLVCGNNNCGSSSSSEIINCCIKKWVMTNGWCLDCNSLDQNIGTSVHFGLNEIQCLTKCQTSRGAKGCEHSGSSCAVHTHEVSKGNGNKGSKCWATQTSCSRNARSDGRCGDRYSINGKPGQCVADESRPCCSPDGWCGSSWNHCKCQGCVDFRKRKSVITELSDKTVTQDTVVTEIVCHANAPSNYDFEWSFIKWSQLYAAPEPFVIEKGDSCDDVTGGPYQRRDRPNVVVVCNMNFTRDQGKYTCVAKSEGMKVHDSKSMLLKIHAAPTLWTSPSGKVFLRYRQSVELVCTSFASPPAVPRWHKRIKSPDPKISTPGWKAVGEHKANISWSPEAGGEYICMAYNTQGHTESKVLLIQVEDAPLAPKSKLMTSMIGLSSTLGVLFLLCAAYLSWSRYRILRMKFAPQLSPNEEFQLDPSRSVQEQAAELPYNVSWEFPRIDVSFLKLLGTGYFGRVWEGIAEGIGAFNPVDESELSLKSKMANLHKRGPGGDYFFKYFRKQLYPKRHSTEARVAIKILPESHTQKEYEELAAELKLMIYIGSHKNIVNLLAACTIDGPLWLLLEYCHYGDLLKFIRSRAQLVPHWAKNPEQPAESVNLSDLMRIAIEITEGMSFLSQKGIVHRDLAARNILLNQNLQIKIADFGKARNVGPATIYQMDSEEMIAVRWMALETLQFGAYSVSSDVWSFGVVLWEVFSMGGRPYTGILSKDLANHLHEGARLNAPQHCPEQISEVMLGCWSTEPSERLTFSQLTETLTNILLNVFKPDNDYYSGSADVELATAYVEEELVDSDDMLRQQRIVRLRNINIDVTRSNADRILGVVYEKGSCNERNNEDM